MSTDNIIPSLEPLSLDDLDQRGFPTWWPGHAGQPHCGEGECRRCDLEQDWMECIAETGQTPDGRTATTSTPLAGAAWIAPASRTWGSEVAGAAPRTQSTPGHLTHAGAA